MTASPVGVFVWSGPSPRDRFAAVINSYFRRWLDSLAMALAAIGWSEPTARDLAAQVVEGIQGAIVLARALDDGALFAQSLRRLEGACRPVR